MRDRHGSPFEHSVFTFFVKAPIFMWREHFRHRMASYNEESGRYKVLEPEFYVPGPERKLIQVGKPGAYEFVDGTPEQFDLVTNETKKACAVA
jgi:thymidylate synthase (FAD)